MSEASGEHHRTSLKGASSAECTDSNDLAVVTRKHYCGFLPFEYNKLILKLYTNCSLINYL